MCTLFSILVGLLFVVVRFRVCRLFGGACAGQALSVRIEVRRPRSLSFLPLLADSFPRDAVSHGGACFSLLLELSPYSRCPQALVTTRPEDDLSEKTGRQGVLNFRGQVRRYPHTVR